MPHSLNLEFKWWVKHQHGWSPKPRQMRGSLPFPRIGADNSYSISTFHSLMFRCHVAVYILTHSSQWHTCTCICSSYLNYKACKMTCEYEWPALHCSDSDSGSGVTACMQTTALVASADPMQSTPSWLMLPFWFASKHCVINFFWTRMYIGLSPELTVLHVQLYALSSVQ